MSRAVWLVLAALWLLASSAGASAGARASRAAALPAGPAVVIVAPAKPGAADMESEAYADWAEYLNAFAATKPAGLKLVRMTSARWRQVVRAPVPSDSYATLFLRRDGSVLMHDGMVIEAEAYGTGAAWASGGPAAPALAFGFTQARLQRRR
jgi:hypothetical protein